MVSLLSPGVNVSEIDLTTVTPATSTTDGAFAGQFSWGPIQDIELVEDELALRSRYGAPNEATFVSFFTAANFLAYGNKLRLVRVAASDALNATAEDGTGSGSAGTGVLIKNEDEYEATYFSGVGDVGPFAAKYAGDLGNSLKVSICASAEAYSKTLTGTVSTDGSGNMIGVGTDFTAELEVGSIIVASTGEEAKVVAITDNVTAVLDSDFVVPLSAESVTAKWEYYNIIRFPLGSSSYVSSRSGADDEMHVVVVDEDGLFSGVAGTVLEQFALVSKAFDAKKEDGTSNYYKEVLNRTSDYVYWMDHIPAGTNFGATAQGTTFVSPGKPYTYSLSGGSDGSAVTDGDKILGYDLFQDVERVDVSLVLGGDASATVAVHLINNIVESRQDCIVLLSPPRDDVVNNPNDEAEDVITFRNNLPSSSYAVLDSGWKYQYDKYNDVYRYVPLNGDVAGLMVRTDTVREPWYSPAGLNRGQIKNVVKLAFNPNNSERDDLYLSGINPVVTFPGQGTVLWGNKTLLSKPSAFDRINVRRLLIVLKKSISRAAKYSLFEINDEATRSQFKQLVIPFLTEVQAARGLFDFKVVCDSRNNTAQVIDRNEFVAEIYLKPSRTAEFIQLNFVAVRTGVEFNEIVGQL